MNKTQIIAEAGKNFIDLEVEQSVSVNLLNAKRLVLFAQGSGADVVKFQCHVLEDEQKKRSSERYEWIKRNERATPYEDFWVPLKRYCDELGVEFMCTPMSKMAAEKIEPLVKRWKIGSADIVDMELLKYVKGNGKPVIISTGMSTTEQVDEAVEFLGDSLELINYCVSLYPCPIWKVDFMQILDLEQRYGIDVGWSDHTTSIEIPVFAVTMGATSVEKHFTMDRGAWGPDHRVSLEPNDFKQMVDWIREADKEENVFEEEKVLWDKFRV